MKMLKKYCLNSFFGCLEEGYFENGGRKIIEGGEERLQK